MIAKSASDAVGAALCDSQEQPGEQPGAARSSILQQKTTVIHGWGIVFNEKTTVIHSWDIKKLPPAYDFFKNNSSYILPWEAGAVPSGKGAGMDCRNQRSVMVSECQADLRRVTL